MKKFKNIAIYVHNFHIDTSATAAKKCKLSPGLAKNSWKLEHDAQKISGLASILNFCTVIIFLHEENLIKFLQKIR